MENRRAERGRGVDVPAVLDRDQQRHPQRDGKAGMPEQERDGVEVPAMWTMATDGAMSVVAKRGRPKEGRPGAWRPKEGQPGVAGG